MANIDAIKKREIRGCIMRALSISEGRALSNTSLGNALLGVCTDLEPHLFYLADKGYITIIPVESDEITGIKALINLTWKGIDLVDHTTEDPSVPV